MEIYLTYSKQELVLEANLAGSDRGLLQGREVLSKSLSGSMKTFLPSLNH